MDGLALLNEARSAGLSVTADGHRLTIRGPRRAERLAKLLIKHKADLLPLLSAGSESPAIPRPGPGETVILIPGHPLADFEWPADETDAGPTGPEILRNLALARNRRELAEAADAWDRIRAKFRRVSPIR